MSKYLKPKTILDASNSKVTGLKINANGEIVEIRARLSFTPQDNVPVLASNQPINPIERIWEKMHASPL